MSSLSFQISEAVQALKRGGLVAYPTDTVYGLGASMGCPEAVERVFAVKNRPRHMALPLLVGEVTQIETLAARISPLARCLIDAFQPGALTLVLPASPRVPSYLVTEQGTVALRIPAHPVPLALVEGIGTAVVGTSANLSGMPSPTTAEQVRAQLGDLVDVVVDAGGCGGKESTVVDATGEVPVVLRSGAISKDDIERVCGLVRSVDGGV